MQFIYTHTLLIIGQIVWLYRKALRGRIIKRVWVYVTAAQLYVILMTGCIIYASISLPVKPTVYTSETKQKKTERFICPCLIFVSISLPGKPPELVRIKK